MFRRYSRASDQNRQFLLPIVLYRQQVTNANFAHVSGALTQVSPLIERIPWVVTQTNPTPSINIPDRLIALTSEEWDNRYYYFLYLRDQQPVMAGAKYQYYAVRLNEQREVSEIIDAGMVEIPLNP